LGVRPPGRAGLQPRRMLGPNLADLAAEATWLQGLKAHTEPSSIGGGDKAPLFAACIVTVFFATNATRNERSSTMLDGGMAGKTCLITGGLTGIGLGISRPLAGEGVHLAVASRNPDPDAMEELARLSRGHAIAIKADVSMEAGPWAW
jgi:hypothetical protein